MKVSSSNPSPNNNNNKRRKKYGYSSPGWNWDFVNNTLFIPISAAYFNTNSSFSHPKQTNNFETRGTSPPPPPPPINYIFASLRLNCLILLFTVAINIHHHQDDVIFWTMLGIDLKKCLCAMNTMNVFPLVVSICWNTR